MGKRCIGSFRCGMGLASFAITIIQLSILTQLYKTWSGMSWSQIQKLVLLGAGLFSIGINFLFEILWEGLWTSEKLGQVWWFNWVRESLGSWILIILDGGYFVEYWEGTRRPILWVWAFALFTMEGFGYSVSVCIFKLCVFSSFFFFFKPQLLTILPRTVYECTVHESYNTIHTFKNYYFVIMFSVFSKNKFYPNRPYSVLKKRSFKIQKYIGKFW